MKNIIIFTIIIFIGLELKSQENYFKYHKGINEVEELLVSEEFELAEKNIETILKSYQFRFTKDLVIAAQISFINNHKEKGIYWIKESIKNGYTLKCLKDISLLNNYLTKIEWQEIEKSYKGLRKEYFSKIDINLLKEFSSRYQEEQNSKRTSIYKEIVYSNFNTIKEIINKGQFPGERNIGIDYQRLASKISDCDGGNSKVIVTLLHYDYPISEIGEEIFIEAIEQGKLHPREFAIIYNFERSKTSVLYRNSSKKYLPLSDYKFNFPFGEKIKDLKRVNSDRSKFGICKYQVDLMKVEIEKKYGLKLIFNYR